MPEAVVAVWDIGKTNAKLCAVAKDTGKVVFEQGQAVASIERPPYTSIDTASLWAWFKRSLAQLAARHRVEEIVVTAHGATAALIDDDGLVLPVLDYEDQSPDQSESEYARLRPPFSETLSPALPGSLNYGRGLFWQSQAFPDRFARARSILGYTQYWTWLLCGVAATETTTIGSHSDLWNPCARSFSSLVGKLGWQRLFPPLRRADETLGLIKPELAAETGTGEDCRILCGIHDSNASLLPWLGRRRPFTVSSTGTWVINFSVGASLASMDPARDCAANVSMLGEPIACSRWMGGREHANVSGGGQGGFEDLLELLEDDEAMTLPNQGGQGGPFQHLGDADSSALAGMTPAQRGAAADLYCALALDVTYDLCGSEGDIVIEGAFARNRLLASIAAALRPGQRLLASDDVTGTTAGAARLALPDLPAPAVQEVEPAPAAEKLLAYRRRWRERVAPPSKPL